MNKKVIYTAIFGGKDGLLRPEVIPDGFDFVCFTDEESARHKSFKKNSDVWDVRIVKKEERDSVRNARRFKVLPHRYFPEYHVSIWIDGNIIVRGDVNELVKKYLSDNTIAVYDHSKNVWDPWKNIDEELNSLLNLAQKGRVKDEPEVMKRQVQKYKMEGFASQNGHIVSMIMFRMHNDERVKNTMESWWKEIQAHSRRDQLSFNYVAWKEGLPLAYLPGDSRDNPYFKHIFHLGHRVTLRRRLMLLKRKIFRLMGEGKL